MVPSLREQFPSSLRRFQLISSEELDGAIKFVIRHARGISPEDLPEAVAGVFGFQTTPQGGDTIVADRLAILGDSGLFEMRDKYLFPRVQ